MPLTITQCYPPPSPHRGRLPLSCLTNTFPASSSHTFNLSSQTDQLRLCTVRHVRTYFVRSRSLWQLMLSLLPPPQPHTHPQQACRKLVDGVKCQRQHHESYRGCSMRRCTDTPLLGSCCIALAYAHAGRGHGCGRGGGWHVSCWSSTEYRVHRSHIT